MRTILSPIVYKTVTTNCPICDGKGYIPTGPSTGTCSTCGGKGTITVDFPDD